jgi:tRNA G18 (ribose-2'-O)-methylase SpoU
MVKIEHVEGRDDARLADYAGLNDAGLRRSVEGVDGAGIFVAEGLIVLDRLLRSTYPVRSVVTIPSRLDRVLAVVGDRDVDVLVVEPSVLQAVTGFDLHRGVVAAADRLAAQQASDIVAASRTLAILEGINDHENLGAIARSAAALGVDGLLLDPTCADPLYRRSVRVSMGALLLLPFARLSPWPAALSALGTGGWRVLALTPASEGRPLRDVTVGPGERIAVLLGAEGPGLSAAALQAATERVRIPVRSDIDSLNVGHAAAIAFEALRRV